MQKIIGEHPRFEEKVLWCGDEHLSIMGYDII